MANEETRSRPASRVVSELADLAAKGAQVYPTLMQAGMTYWAKWLEVGIGYYGTAARQWSRAVQEPEKRPEHVQKMLDDFKAHLLSLAQIPGEAVLSFNQKIEELLRQPPDDPAAASSEQALRQRVGEGIRRVAASAEVRKAAAKAKLDVPDAARLVDALTKLGDAQSEVERRRIAVHTAAEAAIQATRKLEKDLEPQEDSAVEMLRGLAADLERINAAVAPARKPKG